MTERKHWLRTLLAVAFAAFTLAACGNNANDNTDEAATQEPAEEETAEVENPAPDEEQSFTYAIANDPDSTNPLNVTGRWEWNVTNILYSPLIRKLGDGSEEYVLATDQSVSEDGKTIHITLRDDVKWSDGEPFTADDVVFTYNEKAKPENGNADNLRFNDEPIVAEKIDDTHVDFHVPIRSAAAIENLATEIYIIPKHVFEDEPDLGAKQLQHDPVGTGPYVLDEYKHGEYLHFKANPYYLDGEPNIPDITFRIIGNKDTKKVALQKGEIDASLIDPSDVEDLDDEKIQLYPYNENNILYVGLNKNYPTLKNKKVRQALFYAIDQDAINKATFFNDEYYTKPNSVLPNNNSYHVDASPYHYDPEKAKQLLEESGETDFHVNLAFDATSTIESAQAELLQEQLNAVGFDVELAGGDSNEYIAETRKRDSTKYALFLNGYIVGNDPDLYRFLFQSDGASNYFKNFDDKTDELFEQGALELDPDKRKEIYAEWQKHIMDEAFIYPLTDAKKLLAVNKRIGGIEEAQPTRIYTLKDWSKLTINE